MDFAMMRTWLPRRTLVCVALAALAAFFPCVTVGADDWQFDILRLKNGGVLKGMLVDEDENEVRFCIIARNTGAPTRPTTTTTIPRNEIAGIDRLDAKERKKLEERLQTLDLTGEGEKARMKSLQLKSVPWVTGDGSQALRYTSEFFVLTSNAREEIVRRAAVRLDDIYNAYVRYLPPRRQKAERTAIILVRSVAEYRIILKDQGRNILNPAFYDLRRNQVVCATELQKLGDKLEQVRGQHQKALDELKEREAALRRQHKGNVPAPLLVQIQNAKKEIAQANRKNDGIFDSITRELFQTLYHEAFHAYLANFVYPPEEVEVPRWLNEGLAQIFETAIVEAGELRVGHVDKERLTQIRDMSRAGRLVPIKDLLTSSSKEFLVAQARDQQISDRYYLNSWALASYLTFDRRLLGSPVMHRYVQSLKRGANEMEAFASMVGKPLPQFEKEYQQYLSKLQPDGTASKPLEKK